MSLQVSGKCDHVKRPTVNAYAFLATEVQHYVHQYFCIVALCPQWIALPRYIDRLVNICYDTSICQKHYNNFTVTEHRWSVGVQQVHFLNSQVTARGQLWVQYIHVLKHLGVQWKAASDENSSLFLVSFIACCADLKCEVPYSWTWTAIFRTLLLAGVFSTLHSV